MQVKKSDLSGVLEIQLEPKFDERGFFMRTYDEQILREYGVPEKWVQENQSFSKNKGTVRGLHFQHPPHCEAKLVFCLSGEIWVVLVDLRKNSATFGKWRQFLISDAVKNMIFIPRGFAMGMCTLTDNCMLHYKMDNYYFPQSGDTIKWNDPDLAIDWPIKDPVVISEKDSQARLFKDFLDSCGGLQV